MTTPTSGAVAECSGSVTRSGYGLPLGETPNGAPLRRMSLRTMIRTAQRNLPQ